MNRKNDTTVIINGKSYSLGGFESEEYMQSVANYINTKYKELEKQGFLRSFDADMQKLMVQINIADDYYKLKQQIKELEEDLNIKSNEIYDLKHKIVAAQTQYEVAEREIKALRLEDLENQKKMVRMETELEELRKHS